MPQLTPKELQEWMIMMAISRGKVLRQGKAMTHTDLYHILEFMTGFLLALPDAAVNSIGSKGEVYMTERHDTFCVFPVPFMQAINNLEERHVVNYASETGYYVTLNGKDYLRQLSERLRGYREVIAREPVGA